MPLAPLAPTSTMIFTSDPLSLPATETLDTTVLLAPGELSACDVWFEGPYDWADDRAGVIVRLYGVVDGIRVPLAEALLRSVTTGSGSNTRSGIVLSCRDKRVEQLEVTLSRTSQGPALSDGRLAMTAWTNTTPRPATGAGGAAHAPMLLGDEAPRLGTTAGDVYRVTGAVIDADSGIGLAGLRVEACLADDPYADLLALARTDEEGCFSMSVAEDDINARGSAQVACFRVIDDSETALLLLDAATSPRWVLAPHDVFLRLPVAPNKPLSRSAKPARCVIRGRLFGADGPLQGKSVRAFDKQLSGLTALSVPTTTDERGAYEITYDPHPTSVAPSLVVRAFDDPGLETLIAESPERCGAPPTLRLDLVITGERYLGRPRRALAMSAVLSRLGSQPLTSVTEEQRSMLACSAGVGRQDVDALVDAALIAAASPALDEDLAFALLHRGFGASREAFFAHNMRTVRTELAAALDENLISQKHHRDFDAALNQWIDAAAAFQLEPRSGRAGLAELLTVADVTLSEDRLSIARKLVGHEGDIKTFWSTLGVSPATEERLQLTFQWSSLARGHLPLIQYLESRRLSSEPVDLASLAAKDWLAWLDILNTSFGGSLIGAPTTIPGASAAEQYANFAKLLATTLATAFPMNALVARVNQHESPAIQSFFASNPDFQFRKDRLSELDPALPDEDARRLRAMERLFSLVPYYEPIKVLLDAGIQSVTEVHTMGHKAFMDRFGNVLGEAVAQAIYSNSAWIASAATVIHGKLAPAMNQGNMPVLPNWSEPSTQPNEIPDWASLFGSAGGCKCKHCRSVLGPAAYLVDLLEFLGRQPSTEEKSAGTFWTAKDVLLGKTEGELSIQGRRPDIGRLALDCANAETPRPYIDLVNEILEVAVAHRSAPTGTSWAEPASITTDTSAAQLLAAPDIAYPQERHEAWIALSQAHHPFTLPRDFWAESTKLHLSHLGVPRSELVRVLRADAPEYASLLARERLGATALGWQLIVQPAFPSSTQRLMWGYPENHLSFPVPLRQVPTFLARAGLTFEELTELLRTRYVNGVDGQGAGGQLKLELSPATSCDVAAMSLPDLAAGHLVRIQRFLRLRMLLKLSITELDQALAAFNTSDIDESSLASITEAMDLGESLGIQAPSLWALWGQLDTFEGTGPSPYRTLVLNRMVHNRALEVELPAFEALLDDPSGTGEELASHAAGLRQALSISAEDLALLIDDTALSKELSLPPTARIAFADPGDVPRLTLDNLSRLLRSVLIARALRLSVRDYVVLRALLGPSDPFASPPATRQFVEQVRAWRESRLTASGVEYLLRDVGELHEGPGAPALDALVEDLMKGVAQLVEKSATLDDPEGAVVRRHLLAAGVDEPTIQSVLSILAGESELAANDQRSLIQQQFGALYEAQDVVTFPGTPVSPLDLLCPASPEIKPQIAASADRFSYLARRIELDTLARQLVVGRLAEEMGVDASLARLVLGSVLRSPLSDLRSALDDFGPRIWLADPPPDPVDIQKSVRAALKHGRLLRALRLTESLPPEGIEGDIVWAYPSSAVNPSLQDLPMAPPDLEDPQAVQTSLDRARIRFQQFLAVADRVALRDRLSGGRDALREILDRGSLLSLAASAAYMAERTSWDQAAILTLAGHFNIADGAALSTEESVRKLEKAMDIMRRLGASPAQVLAWLDIDAAPPAAHDTPPTPLLPGNTLNAQDLALAARQAVKARYDQDGWEGVARGLMDPFREAERDALVAYLVPNPFTSKEELFAALLLDVEMCPCLLTSRIVEATNAIQVFVQRGLLRLEDSLSFDDEAARQWEWRKNYRVWEANRKVFLYPENWIEPELREDKTPLFEAALTKLGQGELTSASAETVFREYLDGLAETGRLEVRAMVRDTESGTDYFLARTRSTPYKWYHRTRAASGMWSPWQSAPLDVENDHVVLLWAERRLYAVWPVYTTRAEEKQFEGQPPRHRYEIRLAWSSLFNGAWSPKRISDEYLVLRPAGIDGSSDGVPRHAMSLLPEGSLNLSGAHLPTLVLAVEIESMDPSGALLGSLVPIGTFRFDGCGGGRFFATQAVGNGGKPLTEYWELSNHALMHGPLVNLNQPEKARVLRNTFVEGGSDALVLRRTWPGSSSLDARLVLGKTPGRFRVVAPARAPITAGQTRFAFDRFVYQDDRRVFFAEYVETRELEWHAASKAHPGMGAKLYPASQWGLADSDPMAGWAEEQVSLIPHEYIDKGYRFTALYHPFVCELTGRLATRGLPGLLGWQDEPTKSPQHLEEAISSDYEPHYESVESFPVEDVDFSPTGSYSAYNWELFFHLPMTIACALHREQRFAEARQWFHHVFDPTTGSSEDGPRRYWKLRPFHENLDLATIQEQLANLEAMAASEIEGVLSPDSGKNTGLLAQIAAWENDPFDPHTIARMRLLAYQKWVVMRYLQNLFDWADSLFRQDTMESLHEALQLYLLAGAILGPRPTFVDHGTEEPSKTYSALGSSLDPFGNKIMWVELLAPPPPSGVAAKGPPPLDVVAHTYFCVPPNDRLLGLWDLLADRLFKLRNCMNIEGIVRDVALFAPPIDPGLLVRATAAGVRLDKVLSDLAAPAPLYRFRALHAKAMELATSVQALGSMLLSALEKKDGEQLTMLRQQHEHGLLRAEVEIRKDAIADAKATLEGLQRSRRVTEEREQYYRTMPYMIPEERHQIRMLDRAQLFQTMADGVEAGVATAAAFPDITTGTVGPFPLSIGTTGGVSASGVAQAGARGLAAVSHAHSYLANKSGTTAGHKRRRDDARHQAELARRELAALDKQIAAAEIRVAIAERELRNLELRIEQNREIERFLRDKFTGTALYTWMSSELAAEHYRAYSLAYDLAKRAERAFQLERANPSLSFISFGYWDNLKKGLLSGERLVRDLRIMEAAYMADARRDLEITKHVSLAALDASKLIELRHTGETTFAVPEIELDADYPGHYLRRIKTVALTVPVAVPPEEGVRAELTLHKSTFRRTSTLDQGNYEEQGANDERFVRDPRAHMGLVTSTGQSDPGMFEVNLRDELLLPFEGAGADSEWHVSIPKETNAFPLHEISDVILHLRYTAKDGGAILRTKAKSAVETATTSGARKLTRIFDVKSELPDAWEQFVRGTGDPLVQEIAIPLSTAHVKRLFGGKNLKVVKVTVSATFAQRYIDKATGTPKINLEVLLPDDGGTSGPLELLFAEGEPSVSHGTTQTPLAVDIPAKGTVVSPWKLKLGTLTNLPAEALGSTGLLLGDVFERLFVVFHYAGAAGGAQ